MINYLCFTLESTNVKDTITYSFQINLIILWSEVYSEPSQTSRKELFAKIVNGLKPFINFYSRKLYPGCFTGFWIRLWLFDFMMVSSLHFRAILIHNLYKNVTILWCSRLAFLNSQKQPWCAMGIRHNLETK